MKSEKEKMLAGEWFEPSDAELGRDHREMRLRLKQLNSDGFADMTANFDLLTEILPNCSRGTLIQPPFYCDYGYNIFCGSEVYFNYNCVVLDVGRVTIGSRVMFGPNVQIYAVEHPLKASERAQRGVQRGVPVTIGDDCWIGGSAVICPGVTIGNRCVVGAGAVVTHDVPDDVMMAGVPARIIRRL